MRNELKIHPARRKSIRPPIRHRHLSVQLVGNNKGRKFLEPSILLSTTLKERGRRKERGSGEDDSVIGVHHGQGH